MSRGGTGSSQGLAPSARAERRDFDVAGVQRARIVAAAIEVCAEHGAANLTAGAIIAHTGLSRRTFYQLFGDSRECMLAALEQCIAAAAGRVVLAADSAAMWSDRVRAAMVALLGFADEEPAMARLLLVESLAAGPQALRIRARAIARMAAAIETGREQAGALADGSSPLLGEWTVGAALSILHGHLSENGRGPLLALANQLMSLVVLGYLGPTAARAELERAPVRAGRVRPPVRPSGHKLGLRVTYRTMRVLIAVAERPGSSNREVGRLAGVEDQGQISKLLTRLQRRGLLENARDGSVRGAPSEWWLTAEGCRLHDLLVHETGVTGRAMVASGARYLHHQAKSS